MYKKSAVILGLALLVGCSDTSVETTKEVKPKPTVSTPAPAPITKKTAPKVDQHAQDLVAMAAYGEDMKPIINDITTILNGITEVANIGAESPAIILDPEYLKTVKSISSAITRVTANIRAVDTQNNAKVEEAHSYMMKAADALDYVAENYPKAIENMDADEINTISSYITDVGNYASQSTEVITSVTN